MEIINRELVDSVRRDDSERLHNTLRKNKVKHEILVNILIFGGQMNSVRCVEYLIMNIRYSEEELERCIEKARMFSNPNVERIINLHKVRRIINNIN